MDVSLYADSFHKFCHYLPQEASVLELACGPGNITNYLLHKRPDLKILATDLAPNMLELARLNNPTATFELMDCRNIPFTTTFNAVMCGFCLPYLSEQETAKLLSDSNNLLQENGILYLSTMEENSYHSSGIKTNSHGDQTYMYYHKAAFLENTLLKNKFRIVDVSRKITPASDGTSTTDLILIAQKAGIVFA
jgi:trans-aconitate methyltransferase